MMKPLGNQRFSGTITKEKMGNYCRCGRNYPAIFAWDRALPSSRGCAPVARVAEREEGIEDERQKKDANSEHSAFVELLRHPKADKERDDDVHERNEHEQHPPARFSGDLAEDVNIVDRDEDRPAETVSKVFSKPRKA